MSHTKPTLDHLADQLAHFLKSPDLFRIVWSTSSHVSHPIPPRNAPTPPPSAPERTTQRTFTPQTAPKTLCILDSSFNPPTRAHLSLALSALNQYHSHNHDPTHAEKQKHEEEYPKPHRLLLLFSVHNATKAPAPAAFEQRLGMMVAAALDFRELWRRKGGGSSGRGEKRVVGKGEDEGKEEDKGEEEEEGEEEDVEVDVGITKEPYYHHKSAAIDDSGVYLPTTEHNTPSSTPQQEQGRDEGKGPTHIHLIGWDTFMRVLDPKYYCDEHDPPLSALDGFFERHGLLVTLRSDFTSTSADGAAEGEAKQDNEKELKKQRHQLQTFKNGERSEEGLQKTWFTDGRIRSVEPDVECEGVSSTAVRRAVENGDWGVVERFCTPGVAGWVREMGPYGGGGKL